VPAVASRRPISTPHRWPTNKDRALSFLQKAAAENATPAWKHLNWQTVIKRVTDLVLGPHLVNQRGLNACGPAVFFKLWFERDPLGAAVFAYRLLKSGAAEIGPINVNPRASLVAKDYNAIRARVDKVRSSMPAMPEEAEWMLMGALRDSENMVFPYPAEPRALGESASGMTLPMTLTSWLRATNVYSFVANDTDIRGASRESLLNLVPSNEVDVVILCDSALQGDLYPETYNRGRPPKHAPEGGRVGVPQHYIHWKSQVHTAGVPPRGWYRVDIWSQGKDWVRNWISQEAFISSYFGAITAVVRR
jgi:hypothetical protein